METFSKTVIVDEVGLQGQIGHGEEAARGQGRMEKEERELLHEEKEEFPQPREKEP